MQLSSLFLFTAVAGAHFLALLIPGPDFVLILKSAIQNRRLRALGLVAGITMANSIHIALALAGMAMYVADSPLLVTLIKGAGGIYLAYLGAAALFSGSSRPQLDTIIVDAGQPSVGPQRMPRNSPSFRKEFATGLFSSLLNPKLPLFYMGLFSLLLEQKTGPAFRIALGIWMAAVVFAWDALLVTVFSSRSARQALTASSGVIMKCCGILLLVLGFSLIMSIVSHVPN